MARVMRGSAPPRGDRIVAVRAYYQNVGCADEPARSLFRQRGLPGLLLGYFRPEGARRTSDRDGAGADTGARETPAHC